MVNMALPRIFATFKEKLRHVHLPMNYQTFGLREGQTRYATIVDGTIRRSRLFVAINLPHWLKVITRKHLYHEMI
jgi:hypothetical protein